MAPIGENPEEQKDVRKEANMLKPLPPGYEIVISGMAGRFPDSYNVLDFKENLFNKVDLVSGDDRRWKLDHPEIPQRTGKMYLIDKFDSNFFGFDENQSNAMDPMGRMLLERTFEAIIDAGINPTTLKGTNTGVFIGACFSETEKTWFYEECQSKGYGIPGCSRSMLANRLSHWLGLLGPSYAVDSACSSSLLALEKAYHSVRNGYCDTAIVGGSNLCLHPFVSLQFSRLGVLSPNGQCRSFDDSANGYTRSEALSIIILQRAKDANRVYAQVVHAKTNCDGYKVQGITYPSGKLQAQLLQETYEECGVQPSDVAFIEAHGTGTKVGDPEEINALDKVFCTGRKEQLPIGSVKSNVGHSEPASGLCSVTKVCIAMECGKLPPNLHYNKPKEGVKALEEGRMRVITDGEPWNGGLVGINSFGFGGANVHVLLKSKDDEPTAKMVNTLPYVICVSARTQEGVLTLLKGVKQKPSFENRDDNSTHLNVGAAHLLQSAFSKNIAGHFYRGYSLFTSDGQEIDTSAQYWGGKQRKIAFIFSGTEFPVGVGRDLLQLPIFAASIDKCHQILLPLGVDLKYVFTTDNVKVLNNFQHNNIAITALHIGLVDVLRAAGIQPDFIVGHSLGELACAYANDSLTLEQTILSSYYRARVLINQNLLEGASVTIKLPYKHVMDILPLGLEISCNLSPKHTTVCGPLSTLKTFVTTLKSQGVSTSNIIYSANYHSKLIKKASQELLQYLQIIIPSVKSKSKRWISTSLSADFKEEHSAEYHVSSLLNPVLFSEAISMLPVDTMCVEISPQTMLGPFTKQVIGGSYIGLCQTSLKNSCESLFGALGQMYNLGVIPNMSVLVPPHFPVPRGTPMLSHLIEWQHTTDWHVTSYRMQDKQETGERIIILSTNDEEAEYLTGHIIDGRNLFPATAYLTVVWETLGLMKGELYTNISVCFEDIRFLRATNIPKDGTTELTIMIQKGTGKFEIMEGGSAVVTGTVYTPLPSKSTLLPPLLAHSKEDSFGNIPLNNKDIYKELKLRGYNYQGLFKGVLGYDSARHTGQIQWSNNWVAFMDNMLQVQILYEDTRSLFVPTAIQKLQIDTKTHISQIHAMRDNAVFDVHLNPYTGVIRSGGVEIVGLKATAIQRRKPDGDAVLEKYVFIPNSVNMDNYDDSIRTFVQIGLENIQVVKVKTVEILERNFDEESSVKQLDKPLSSLLHAALADLPLIHSDVNVLVPSIKNAKPDLGEGISVDDKKLLPDSNFLFVVGTRLLDNIKLLDTAVAALRQNGFIISREPALRNLDNLHVHPQLNIICRHYLPEETIILLQKKSKKINSVVMKIRQDDVDYSWLTKLQNQLKNNDSKVLLVAENEALNGILGLVNCIRKEPGGDLIRCVFVMDEDSPTFDLKNPFYEKQLDLNLAVNIYKNGEWGTYRHLQLKRDVSVMVSHSYVNVLQRGDLSSLRWIEGPLKISEVQEENQHLGYVYYSALNFRDIMTATGKISPDVVAKGRINQECVQGLEYSGRDATGRRVMGLLVHGALSSIIKLDPYLCWTFPDDWTLQDAATVPVVYATVYYAMLAGNMAAGETILIHAGSGGVGQAAISVCLHAGCKVLTTVGTDEKRKFLLERFPQLKDEDIGNSRDTSFEQMVMRRTGGRGVDIVLNSLAEEKLIASLRCLARHGRFLEIGKFDLANNNLLGLGVFMNESSFHGVTLENLFTGPEWEKQRVGDMVMEGIKAGAVRPLTRTVFAREDIEQAFRYMAQGKHIGKVLISMRPEEEEQVVVPCALKWPAAPRFFCDPKGCYVIVGGLGGFGLELADWLALRGARHIVLSSRKGVVSGYQVSRIKIWKSYGISVNIFTSDITTENGCYELLDKARKIAPVKGIFNLAVILQDGIFENQTAEMFSLSLAPKANATAYLDKASRKLCPDLGHFIVFSSVSCGRGNAGQSNYGMANSVMERICEKRVSEGLPAFAIQWGAVGEVGLVADLQEDHKELEIGGTLQQRVSSCLSVLDNLLTQGYPVVASMVVAEKRSSAAGAGGLVATVVNILGLRDIKTVSPHSNLAELGMDSLMAVEIKQALERDFEVFLTAQDIRSLTFARLSELAVIREAQALLSDPASSGHKAVLPLTEGAHGVQLLIKVVGEEHKAHLPIVRLPSLVEHNDPLMFIIPGIEGSGTILLPLAEQLRCRVECLQIPIPHTSQSIQEMATQMLPFLLERQSIHVPFNLVAYSFGSMPLLELVLLLEAMGARGRIILIDGAPKFLQGMAHVHITADSKKDEEDQLQLEVLIGILSILAPGDHSSVKKVLETIPEWTKRVDTILEAATKLHAQNSSSAVSNGYIKALCDAMLIRVKATLNNDTTKLELIKIKSSITLIKPTGTSLAYMSEDYDLSEYTENKVEIILVEGHHANILEKQETADIINKLFGFDSGKHETHHVVADKITSSLRVK